MRGQQFVERLHSLSEVKGSQRAVGPCELLVGNALKTKHIADMQHCSASSSHESYSIIMQIPGQLVGVS